MKKSELRQIIKEEISKVLNKDSQNDEIKDKIMTAFQDGAGYVHFEGYYDREEVIQASEEYIRGI